MTSVGSKDEQVGAQTIDGQQDVANTRDAAVTLNVAGPGVAASIVRLTSAISLRLEEDAKSNVASSGKADARAACKQQHEIISGQVSRAEGLIQSRMTWTLQFNGFLFAALAVTLLKVFPGGEGRPADTTAPWLLTFLLGAIPLAGLAITASGWLGVQRGVSQLRYLAHEYARNVHASAVEHGWPGPFADLRRSGHGTAAAQLSFALLCLLWLCLGAHQVWPAGVEKFFTLLLHAVGPVPAATGS